MTKRFIIDASGDFRDTKDGSTIIDFGYAHNSMECKMILDLLNELHEENTRLQNEIQDFQNLLTEREETFLKPIYTALDDAILNERTALGKSALKQFKQTIME